MIRVFPRSFRRQVCRASTTLVSRMRMERNQLGARLRIQSTSASHHTIQRGTQSQLSLPPLASRYGPSTSCRRSCYYRCTSSVAPLYSQESELSVVKARRRRQGLRESCERVHQQWEANGSFLLAVAALASLGALPALMESKVEPSAASTKGDSPLEEDTAQEKSQTQQEAETGRRGPNRFNTHRYRPQVRKLEDGGVIGVSSSISSSPSDSSSPSSSPTSPYASYATTRGRQKKRGKGPRRRDTSLSSQFTTSAVALRGRRPYMEDSYYISSNKRFVGVFDGHGGSQVSLYLKERLFPLFAAEVKKKEEEAMTKLMEEMQKRRKGGANNQEGEELGTEAMEKSKENTDAHVKSLSQQSTEDSEGDAGSKIGSGGQQDSKASRFDNAQSEWSFVLDTEDIALTTFKRLDEDICKRKTWAHVGSTAAVVYLEDDKIWSFNVGDSRAILCRRGKAVPLTRDHKPIDPQEKKRIEKLGGDVSWHGWMDKEGQPIPGTGAYRVNGNLAVARSMGDADQRPYVSCTPEVLQSKRDFEGDQFIVVASDGLWDVMDNASVVTFVLNVLSSVVGSRGSWRSGAAGESSKSLQQWKKEYGSEADMIQAAVKRRKGRMAQYLAEEAMQRGSADNVTIVVLWLK